MSQRKAKEYRQAMEQYRGAVEDVDDLKRRIGAMEARHRREDQLEEIRRRQARREAEQWEKKRKKSMEQARRVRAEERRRQLARRQIAVLIAGALVVVLLLALAIKAMTADTAAAEELEITATCGPVTLLTAEPDVWDGEGLFATNPRTTCRLNPRPMSAPILWPWPWRRLKATLTWRPWAPPERWGSCS